MPKDSLRTRVANKFAEANRTGATPKVSGREQRLVDDVTAKLAKANQSGKSAEIPKRWAPVVARVARTPQAGFTPELLRAQKQKLKPVEEVRVHGELDNVHVKRTAGQDAGSFVDLAADARRSMHTLMSKPGGNQMMKELDARVTQNRAHAGDQAKVYIRALKPGDASNMNAPHATPGVEEGYRFDGKEGKGWGSEVRINANEATANRFIGLGHEMVHAHRLAHGKAVGVPQLNQANHPLFNDPISQGADVERGKNAGFGKHLMEVVQTTNHLQEEFETVGLSKTPRGAFNPSENILRAEHGLPARTDYSKTKPGHMDETVAKVDELFDKRSGITKAWHGISGGKPPTPVSDMIKRYKD
ncbi:M91 family zinc metallopeptidase [Dyella koreensis]|uniref:Effector protein n=1 Tax=Dyella koreensis TaxID=311235 RepID=A0ABW8K8Y4_9GAMM